MQSKFWRVGRRIKAGKVRVIGEDGKQIGVLPIEEALRLAEEKGLDLVEIVPDADPPVCKIVDFGRFLYEQKKKEKEIKKGQKSVEIKEMRFSPKIQEHDIEIKVKKIKEWLLEEDAKVKIVVKAKGREALYEDVMKQVIDKVMNHLGDVAEFEKPPYKEGRNLSAIITKKRK